MALTDEAIEKIKEMIVSGSLSPGERLPKEDDLARTLGISRNSLREAVRALTLVRILDVRQGDGTYVTSLEPRLLLDAVSFVADFHRDDSVLYLIEVRRMLEPQATALAARRIKRGEVQRLSALVDEVDADSDVETLVANDLEFHRRIADSCGNPVLSALLDSVSVPTARARVWRGLTEDRALERTLDEHHEIVDALARHEPEIAAARAATHIAGLEDWLRKAL
ncbi:MAG TPA: FadR/GntR family transcriptional regulator [Solirubrobacteraceae bacterium]|nr:FadR/GntR family transcriptional regulator [Solirubrobacteraceae bacterium]